MAKKTNFVKVTRYNSLAKYQNITKVMRYLQPYDKENKF
jgi:hypothetical protein